MDKMRRYCEVSLRTASQYFVLNISFPTNYPNNEAPTFDFVDWSESIGKKQQEVLLLVSMMFFEVYLLAKAKL